MGRVFLCTALSFLLALVPHSALASDLELVHKPPFEGYDMPESGLPIAFSVQLLGTQEITRPLKAYLVKDGRLLVLPASSVKLNAQDNPEYLFELQAPQRDLFYWFVLGPDPNNNQSTDGRTEDEVIESSRYRIERECLARPLYGQTQEQTEDDQQGRTGVLEGLLFQSRDLEHERFIYDQSIIVAERLLDELSNVGTSN